MCINDDKINSPVRLIPNSELSLELIPPFRADYNNSITPFALTFDGYNYCGSQKKCFELALDILDGYKKTGSFSYSLSQLRSALFFLQRDIRWSGYDIDVENLRYAHALVEAIRDRVAAEQIE